MPDTDAQTAFANDTYGFEIKPLRGEATARVDGVTLASSSEALVLTETRLDPVCYFPPADVRTDLLEPSATRTYCPIRGNANYWHIRGRECLIEDAAWSYPQPFHDARRIKDYIAFHQERLDEFVVESMPARPIEPHYANPLVDWLLHEAPGAGSIVALIEQFTERCRAANIPIWRVWLSVRTLHPLLFSTSYTWQEPDPDDPDLSAGGIVERTTHHGALEHESFLDSPLRPIIDGAGGVRCRLEGDDPDLDYPIVREHWQAGATDYVAMPVVFSDGQINVLSLTTKTPGGFSTQDLGSIYEILPALSRVLEVHSARRKSVSLLQTYLGRQAGERVLNGLIRRGDRDRIECVIWFADLRESSRLAERQSSDAYLDTLNNFYDCVAQPVLDRGGEILRFIGDAALAIFPLDPFEDDRARAARAACVRAVGAIDDARAEVYAVNQRRPAGLHLSFGIGLHLGEVTYGNIGTTERLEFTVIGPAANFAARLQDLCKSLERSVIVSQAFVDACRDEVGAERFETLGSQHTLRGISTPAHVHALL